MNHLNQKKTPLLPKIWPKQGVKTINFDSRLLSCPGVKMTKFEDYENFESYIFTKKIFRAQFWV